MLREELIKLSPIRVLEKSINGGLGKGNLGVFTARKGVGKTATLVHVAVDKLLRNNKVIHLSFSDNPRHIEIWYDHVFNEIAKAYNLENILDNQEQIIKNRLIINLNKNSTDPQEIESVIKKCMDGAKFYPAMFIVDGFSFYDRERDDFLFWKKFAEQHNAEIWFSATLHRHSLEFDDQGIPSPASNFKDLFSVIIMLEPKENHISLKLLKDHDNPQVDQLKLKLNPKTMLIANHRV